MGPKPEKPESLSVGERRVTSQPQARQLTTARARTGSCALQQQGHKEKNPPVLWKSHEVWILSRHSPTVSIGQKVNYHCSY